MKTRVLTLVRELYSDFGPTLLSETLDERHGIRLSRETLRVWMSEAGLWLSQRQRRSVHQLRLRREHLGELVQIDGSEHRWFEDRGPPCSLLVLIDDATGRLMQLRFVKSESAFSYFEALRGYLDAQCLPTEPRMRAGVVVIGTPPTEQRASLASVVNSVSFKSSRSRPLNDSMKAFWVGFPGAM